MITSSKPLLTLVDVLTSLSLLAVRVLGPIKRNLRSSGGGQGILK